MSAALVTGASRGIGRGIALELAALGWDVIINYARNEAAASGTREACVEAGRRSAKDIAALPFKADISTTEGREQLVRFARDQFPSLDMLVNNAGVAPEARADILELSEASFDRLQSVNAKGPFFLTQAIAKWMLETPGGALRSIVTISSISAVTVSLNRADYCMSKAALSMLTPLFAARLAGQGINTYEIRPGVIATDMTAGVKATYDELISKGLTPIQRWGVPSDVGKVVAAIAQGLLPFTTGEVINVDGGFHIRRL